MGRNCIQHAIERWIRHHLRGVHEWFKFEKRSKEFPSFALCSIVEYYCHDNRLESRWRVAEGREQSMSFGCKLNVTICELDYLRKSSQWEDKKASPDRT